MQKTIDKLRTLKSYPAYWGRSIFPDTVLGAKSYSSICKIFNWGEHNKRQKILGELKKQSSIEINDTLGYLIEDMSSNPVVMDAIAYAKNMSVQIKMSEQMAHSKKSFLLNHSLDMFASEHEALLKLATHELLLTPIAKYLNDVPVLASIAIWFSPNDGDTIQRSQLYHMDGEDTRQIKCFIPIDEVTPDSGPLHIFDANKSEQIYKSLKLENKVRKRNEKIQDDLIYSIVPKSAELQVVGKPGTVAFVDTSRCYHFGSRPAPKPRLQLHIQYYTAYSMNMPVWGRKPMPVNNKKQSPPIYRAVTGLSHLDFAQVRRKRGFQ